MDEKRIAMIGLGQMGRALAAGWVRAGVLDDQRLIGWDPVESVRGSFAEEVPAAQVGASNRDAVAASDLVLLAVKPHLVGVVAREIRDLLTPAHLVVSVAAGVTLQDLTAALGTERVARVMPNTPCLVGQGALAYCLGSATRGEDEPRIRRLLEAVGAVFAVDERLMDAVTGLSGSGPAYVYLMIEALSDGGVRAGLPRELATALAARTVRGAADMVLATGDHPAVLRERVTSPGGTTSAGLEALEMRGARAAFLSAVTAAAHRATELRGSAGAVVDNRTRVL